MLHNPHAILYMRSQRGNFTTFYLYLYIIEMLLKLSNLKSVVILHIVK
jgi:hypothetical protein